MVRWLMSKLYENLEKIFKKCTTMEQRKILTWWDNAQCQIRLSIDYTLWHTQTQTVTSVLNVAIQLLLLMIHNVLAPCCST